MKDLFVDEKFLLEHVILKEKLRFEQEENQRLTELTVRFNQSYEKIGGSELGSTILHCMIENSKILFPHAKSALVPDRILKTIELLIKIDGVVDNLLKQEGSQNQIQKVNLVLEKSNSGFDVDWTQTKDFWVPLEFLIQILRTSEPILASIFAKLTKLDGMPNENRVQFIGNLLKTLPEKQFALLSVVVNFLSVVVPKSVDPIKGMKEVCKFFGPILYRSH